MADQKSRELSIKVDVDVSDALTGLKAVQREAKQATRALRELEEARSTKALHEALVQREGVTEYIIDAHDNGNVLYINGRNIFVEGPARIVVNCD